MVRESESEQVGVSSQKRGTAVHRGAQECTGISPSRHAAVARALWPRKTAAHWAVRAGVQERIAKYWLAGGRRVSAEGKLAILRELD